MRIIGVAVLLALTLPFVACSRLDKARRETTEDTDEEPRSGKAKRKPSSKKLVFDETPSATAPARLTFEPAPTEPTVDNPARYDFLLEAVHRIGPQLRTLESAPRITQLSIRRDRVDADLIAASGDMIRSIDLKGDAVLDGGTKKDIILKTAAQLSERAFAIEDVEWAKIPSLAKDAPGRVADGEVVDFVSIKRPLPFSKDVQIRVFVKPSHFVDYTAKGAFISAN